MLHIIVTGPESSGKTTLARGLAKRLGASLVPEYTRGYLEALGRRARAEDFVHFARANQQLVAAGMALEARLEKKIPVVVQDTGPEVLRIWVDDKLGGGIPEIDLGQPRPNLVLLCRPDLPWEYDPLREDPHRREALFRRFRELIDGRGMRCVEVSGFGESRLQLALRAVEAKYPKLRSTM